MHVGIEEPTQRRKEVLKIAIDAIQTLKDFEVRKKIESEKTIYRKHFIQIVKDLGQSIHEFKEMMPIIHTLHPEEKKEGIKPTAEEEIKSVEKPIIKRTKTHLEKLEDDITYLRSKIANL